MIEKQSNIEQHPKQEMINTGRQEIDILEIFRKIISIRKTLYKAFGIGLVIGIVVALSTPKQYTVQVTLSPEMKSSKGSNALAGLAASFLGSGANSVDGIDALNMTLSADIISSTPFLLELSKMKVVTSKHVDITLGSYLNQQSSPWWNYIIGFPGIIIGGVKSLFSNVEGNTHNNEKQNTEGIIELTNETAEKIGSLRQSITAIVDKKTAITQVSVTLQDPKVTAIVADTVVNKLRGYIINYRTSKSKEDCIYLDNLFKERQKEYYEAQKKYAEYVDSHDNLILQSVRTEQERLQNEMSLAYQVYSQVANQLQVARAKVQEEKPVFAVVEPAVVPLRASGTGKSIYMLLFAFLSVVCTMGWILIGQLIWNRLKDEIRINRLDC